MVFIWILLTLLSIMKINKMKSSHFVISMFLLLSCGDKKETVSQAQSAKKVEKINSKNFHSDNNETLKNWLDYYKTFDPDFNLDNFEFESESSFGKTAGNIYGIYDKEFNNLYSDFLIYSPDRKKYIDIDSNHWILDEDGNPGFEVDQEINLVDIPYKKIEKIKFYGSSNWVEDAYWKDDHTIVLLENSDDQKPAITQMDVNSQKSMSYKYKSPLKNISEYSMQRILAKLKK